jgi:hypothetical protein
MDKIFQAAVVFSFGGVENLDSPEADTVIKQLKARIERHLLEEWSVPLRTVWLEEVYVSEEDEA